MSASNLQELEARVKELRHLVDSCGACDGNGSWREYGTKIHCACCEEYRRELDPLEDQLAIAYNAIAERNKPPEPAWTSEPPKEPGWYWAWHPQSGSECVWVGPFDEKQGNPLYAYGNRCIDGYLPDLLDENVEWHSQPIPEPTR